MKLNQINLKQILPTILLFGLLGGGLLIGTTLLFTKAWLIILPFVITIFAIMFTLKSNKKIELSYLKSVVAGTLTFMLMSIILYLYNIYSDPDYEITFFGHIGRLLAMFGLGLMMSAVFGLFFRKRAAQDL